MACEVQYTQYGSKVTIKGGFHTSDGVVIGDVKVAPEFSNDSLVFTVPNTIETGETTIYVESNDEYISNPVSIIVCEPLEMKAVFLPDRIIQNSPEEIILFSSELKPTDTLLLDETAVQAQKYSKQDGERQIKFIAQCGDGQKEVRVLRKENDVYYLSESFPLLICDLIGNTSTKELHRLNCKWVQKMLPSHKELICSTYDLPRGMGYDNCHWCIGGSKR
jgi:hypothetical protein